MYTRVRQEIETACLADPVLGPSCIVGQHAQFVISETEAYELDSYSAAGYARVIEDIRRDIKRGMHVRIKSLYEALAWDPRSDAITYVVVEYGTLTLQSEN